MPTESPKWLPCWKETILFIFIAAAAAAAFSFAVACSAASATATFQSLAHFISTNTKPSGTMGDTWGYTKNDDHFSHATSFRGYNRFSPLLNMAFYMTYHIYII